MALDSQQQACFTLMAIWLSQIAPKHTPAPHTLTQALIFEAEEEVGKGTISSTFTR